MTTTHRFKRAQSGAGHPARGCRPVWRQAQGVIRFIVPLLVLLTLAACQVGPYSGAPRYTIPETRTTAARWLNDALAFGGRNVSEVAGDELRLTWHEIRNITTTQQRLINRELNLLSVNTVERPSKVGEFWEIQVDADGGAVTFAFDDGETASKAEAALRRLSRPLNDAEQEALARPHFKVLDKHVQEYRRRGETELTAETLDWDALHGAIDYLEMIFGKNYGRNMEAVLDLHAWLENAYGY